MTELTDFQQSIRQKQPKAELRFQEPLSRHTSFRIGGPAEVMAFPKNESELAELLKLSVLLDRSSVILGAGTNVLAPDEGIRGLVICLKDALTGISLGADGALRAMAGETLTGTAVYALRQGLSGLEFAHGIPGTVGGGVYMNAGAYGGEIKDVCLRACLMDRAGQTRLVSGADLDFSYRRSLLAESGEILIWAELGLHPEDPEKIREKMGELKARRAASQPLQLPSAGSAFRRPAAGYAAALIEQTGLKGFQIGGAAISEKHAGFVVNLGGATARDVRALLAETARRVYDATGVRLEPEIRIL